MESLKYSSIKNSDFVPKQHSPETKTTESELLLEKKNIFLAQLKKELYTLKKISDTHEKNLFIEKLIRKIHSNVNDINDKKMLSILLNKENTAMIKYLMNLYPSLSEREIRHCIFIKKNISLDEVANLLCIHPKSVIMARYRIKKKLGLSQNEKLWVFICNEMYKK